MRISGFITLPSERTLWDYTIWTESRTGCHLKVSQQLLDELSKIKLSENLKKLIDWTTLSTKSESFSDWTSLLKEARRVVYEEGYNYTKGNLVLDHWILSRCIFWPSQEEEDWWKLSPFQNGRAARTNQGCYRSIRIQRKCRESASMVHNYKECDQITVQMSELKCEWRKLEIQLAGLTKKQRKSKW